MHNWLVDTPDNGNYWYEIWNEWKAYCLTRSEQIFIRRNKWFHFSKEDIYQNLGDLIPVPQTLYCNPALTNVRFSEALAHANISLDHHNSLVVKRLKGHSSNQVKVLLFSRETGKIFDILHKEELTLVQIDEWCRLGPFLIEQSLYSEREPIPIDFKVYFRNGDPMVVAIFDRNEEKIRISYVCAKTWSYLPWSEIFVNPSFQKWVEGVEPHDDIVRRAGVAVSASSKIITAINAEDLFVSLDTYVAVDEPEVVWLGEITPRPGAIHANKLTTGFIRKLLVD